MTKSRRKYTPRFVWTREAEQHLRAAYANTATKTIADKLGVSVAVVYRKAYQLGLAKSDDFKASELSGRIQRGKQHPSMKASQFKPGLQPWNKGTHWTAGGRSADTRFKKGQMHGAAQHKYVPIGSLRISKDGYLERKFTDDPILYPTRRWVGVHRQVWEAANGPIPAGHVVCFKPGQHSQIEAEIQLHKLECISRAELARRNHPATSNPELFKLIQLKGAITRQVNRINKASQSLGATA